MPFKKIFKPIAKVLDKVIPNEIKPALPYLAAFAPVFAPAGMQGLIGSTMGRRALTSGLLNIGAQLSQEGSEGDINLLSAGLGALTGAMTTPGAADTFTGMTTAEKFKGTPMFDKAMADRTLLTQAKDFGLEGLAKGSELLRPDGAVPNLFSTEGLKAATLPAATATGDVMAAEARRSAKEVADAALLGLDEGASDADRALAIRTAMEAYGYFSDDEIEETITAAGYKAGGRVGLELGGGLGAIARGMQQRRGESSDLDLMTIKATLNQVHTNNDDGEGGGMAAVMEFMEKNPEYKVQVMENIIGDRGDKVRVAPIEETSVNILDGMNTDGMLKDGVLVIDSGMFEKKAKGGRVGFKFGGIDAAIDKVEDESIKESMKFASDIGDMDIPMVDLVEEFEIIFKRKPSSLDELKQFYRDFYEYKGPGENIKMKEKIKEKVVMEAKDGGLMDLGGKEMDLRGGGFVPIGKKERADDVPARLSKNEFVMTADAVRAAGGGSVNKGAKRMYELMNNLEARV